VKIVLRWNVLAGLALALALGVGFHAPARAQAVESQATERVDSAPESQAADKAAREQPTEEKDENDVYWKSPNVVALGAKLGLNPDQSKLAFQLVNFVLLAVFLGTFLVKLLPKMLRERNTAIRKSIVDARTATEEAQARLSSVEERLSKLDGEIAAMRAHAEEDSVRDEQRIKATVEEEKKKILSSAEQEIAAATSHARKLLQQHAAELAVEQAARKLVVSAETDRLLVQGFAASLTDGSKKGTN